MAYSLRVCFIETPIFSDQVLGLLSEESYLALQLSLALRPAQGALIRGGGGLRKLRWAAFGRGKRGGLRLIYYWDEASEVIYMLFLYPKNRQEDLTSGQLRMLRRVLDEELS